MNLRRAIPPLILGLSVAIFIAAVVFAGRQAARPPAAMSPTAAPVAAAIPASASPRPTVAVAPTATVMVAATTATVAPPGIAGPTPQSTQAIATTAVPAPATRAATATTIEPPPSSPPVASEIPAALPPTPTVSLAAPLPTVPAAPPAAAIPTTPPSPLPEPTRAAPTPAPPTAPPRPTTGPATGALPPGAPAAGPAGAPARLIIPSIGVDAAIEPVATDADGNMATPSDPWDTAWFAPGVRPGQPGNAAIAGHVDYRNIGPVVFWDLRTLAPGAEVLVVTDGGLTLRFVVRDAAYFRPESAPLERIFGPSAGVNLNLITCGGTFNPATRQYDQRLVVFTTLVEDWR